VLIFKDRETKETRKEEFSEILSQINTGFNEKYPLLLSDFNHTSNFSTDFPKIRKYQFW
jgi:hypothetical protein